jgi:uncharacterized protein (DUF4415 family)
MIEKRTRGRPSLPSDAKGKPVTIWLHADVRKLLGDAPGWKLSINDMVRAYFGKDRT